MVGAGRGLQELNPACRCFFLKLGQPLDTYWAISEVMASFPGRTFWTSVQATAAQPPTGGQGQESWLRGKVTDECSREALGGHV